MTEQHHSSKRLHHLAELLEDIVDWVEGAVAAVLAVVIVVAVIFVAIATLKLLAALPGGTEASAEFTVVMKAVLDTFIVIELFRITIAYVRHSEIIPTVLETALVVAAREIVVIEAGANRPLAAAAVGGTLVAVGLTWYLLRRARACGGTDDTFN